MMIVASTIYQKPARLLLQPGEVERMRYLVRLAWMLFFQHGYQKAILPVALVY